MLVKIVTFFLIGMAVLAVFGRLRVRGPKLRARRAAKPATCPACGAYRIGKGACTCGKG